MKRRIGLLLLFGIAVAGCGLFGDGADEAKSEDIEVRLSGQQIGDSFCVRRICWPIEDGHVAVGAARVTGSLSSSGLRVSEFLQPSFDDRVIDSNSTESQLQQWLSAQDINQERWWTEGAGNGRARVWIEVVDQAVLEAIETEFGELVDVDGATVILNSTTDRYLELHQEIGTHPAAEPYLSCAGEIRSFDRAEIDRSGLDRTEPKGIDPMANCRLNAYNHNSSNVALASIPEPSGSTLTVLVQEIECASGRMPPVVDVKILVDESSDLIAVGAILVAPPGFVHECPGNPIVEVEVLLDSPVGDRVVVAFLNNEPLPVGMDGQ